MPGEFRSAYITHADCLKHDMGAHHPERPQRLSAIEDQLIASAVGQHLRRYDAPLADDEHLTRVHPAEYVQAIRHAAPEHPGQSDKQRRRGAGQRGWFTNWHCLNSMPARG